MQEWLLHISMFLVLQMMWFARAVIIALRRYRIEVQIYGEEYNRPSYVILYVIAFFSGVLWFGIFELLYWSFLN
jgi:hypothetical protein